jgi:mannose-1-phosphate guanylyltransferase/mannose-6-phosphate isomerase
LQVGLLAGKHTALHPSTSGGEPTIAYRARQHLADQSLAVLWTNGDHVILLTENQSMYIPLGTVHRLANPGKVPLEIIEVQSGSYLGEDDIVRFDDTYGRTK